jgi:hypothetical protein
MNIKDSRPKFDIEMQRLQDQTLFDKIRSGHDRLLDRADVRQMIVNDQEIALDMQAIEQQRQNNEQQEQQEAMQNGYF